MNNDLISRAAFDEVLDQFEGLKAHAAFTEGIMVARRELASAPAVDAEPVRHGQWIPNGDDDMDAGMWHCSECGHEIYSDLSLMEELQEQGYALYCEHCGIKMDAEEVTNG